jgi:uncharacterized protein YcaQ
MARIKPPLALTATEARRLWLRAQRLDSPTPFGAGAQAVRAAIEHLGYVQIDTIHVVERAHHHILWSRIPDYARTDLDTALSLEKTVFEYWAHALAYLPTRDYRFFRAEMKRQRSATTRGFGAVSPADLRRILARIRRDGPLSIRDIDDDPRVPKDHPWASTKPSKRALEFAFYAGDLTISRRDGMLKTYDLTDRHFGWERPPRAATEAQVLDYLLDRALRAQAIVSLDSICHLDAPRKPAMAARLKARRLVPVEIDGSPGFWTDRATAASRPGPPDAAPVHILSPFDPLIIQRKRLSQFFGYDHLFEAYVPAARRRLGYFALPVLVGDRILAAIDLKTDRTARKLLVQNWHWTEGDPGPQTRAAIDEALHRFEAFQLAP